AVWRKPPRIAFDISAGLAIVPSFGGDIVGGCSRDCSRSVGVGAVGLVHGGYELGSGVGFGLSAGYILAAQRSTGRTTALNPKGLPPQPGVADDALTLSAVMGGAAASYHLGERFPVLVRLGVGALYGVLRDERRGRFTPSVGSSFNADP